MASTPKVRKPAQGAKAVHTLTAKHRVLVDPLAHQLNAGRVQVQQMGEHFDQMLTLLFPAWASGGYTYVPQTGEILPIGAKPVALVGAETHEQPIKGVKRKAARAPKPQSAVTSATE